MRKKYPSDISRTQFAQIKELLENARKKTRPRTIDLYDAFCGVLYVLKSGCQWRMLPSDFPKWRSVHAYFQIWSEKPKDDPSLLERALKKVGWRDSYQTWTESKNQFLYCGLPKREEHGHCCK
jgi:transposase